MHLSRYNLSAAATRPLTDSYTLLLPNQREEETRQTRFVRHRFIFRRVIRLVDDVIFIGDQFICRCDTGADNYRGLLCRWVEDRMTRPADQIGRLAYQLVAHMGSWA